MMDNFLQLMLVCTSMFLQGYAQALITNCSRFACEYSLIEKMINLQNENTKLSERLTALQLLLEGRQTAVSAHVRLSGNTPLSGSARVMYDVEISNIGEAYKFNSGQFTAPFGGVYLLHVTACLGSGGRWMTLNIMDNDKVIGRVFVGDSAYHTCGSETLSLHLDSGDNVWVERVAGSATWLNEDHGWNSFTATLLYAD
ncbi:complement C1q-like protein 4 [Mercenaria mercenaria]|uniref:complement C1q-like protein 4 n=1 Tax=Mercenaria mercenaria TaxID=6596 RepID=UPI00234F18F7|nr:complement C1q-like protein 4 [Mercenaria mercenaria]